MIDERASTVQLERVLQFYATLARHAYDSGRNEPGNSRWLVEAWGETERGLGHARYVAVSRPTRASTHSVISQPRERTSAETGTVRENLLKKIVVIVVYLFIFFTHRKKIRTRRVSSLCCRLHY